MDMVDIIIDGVVDTVMDGVIMDGVILVMDMVMVMDIGVVIGDTPDMVGDITLLITQDTTHLIMGIPPTERDTHTIPVDLTPKMLIIHDLPLEIIIEHQEHQVEE